MILAINLHILSSICFKVAIKCMYCNIIGLHCPSFSERPLKQTCDNKQKDLQTDFKGLSPGDCSACQEKCTNKQTELGIPACCECRTTGYCKFYGNGYSKHKDTHKDAKAVLCQDEGKMIHFHILLFYKYCKI